MPMLKPAPMVVEQVPVSGMSLAEVNGLLQKQRSQIVGEFEVRLKQGDSQMFAEVNTMLQKQYLCIKRDVAAMVQREQAQLQQTRASIFEEVQIKIQQDRTSILPQVQSLLDQARMPIMEEVRGMIQSERCYVLDAMKDLVQEQLATLSDSTNSEMSRMVTMINAVSTACEEHLVRLEGTYGTCAMALQEVKQDLVDGVVSTRLSCLEVSCTTATTMLQDLRQELSEVTSRANGLTAEQEDVGAKLNGYAASVYACSLRVNEVVVDLQQERVSISAQQSDVLERQRAEQRNSTMRAIADGQAQVSANVDVALAQLEKSRSLDFQELTQLVKGEGQARADIEQVLDAQGTEAQTLKDRLTSLEKFSQEFQSEVQDWMISCRKNIKRGGGPQSLDRYRELLSLREFRE